MDSNYTNTMYWNPDVELVYQDGNYSVMARKDLAAGTLIMLEHVISGNIAEVIGAVMVDNTLLEQLYPRTEYSILDMRARNIAAQTKMEMNAFRFDDAMVIGNMFSKFNHCCDPNCHMAKADKPNLGGCIGCVPIYGMWVMSKVHQGTELTIDYTSGHAEVHDKQKKIFGWNCPCTKASLAASKNMVRTEIRMNICSKMAELQQDFIRPTVDAYLMTEKGRDILLRHVLGKRGLYETPMGFVGTTPAAAKLDPSVVVDKYSKQVTAKWKQFSRLD
jgi:hypothetical protein